MSILPSRRFSPFRAPFASLPVPSSGFSPFPLGLELAPLASFASRFSSSSNPCSPPLFPTPGVVFLLPLCSCRVFGVLWRFVASFPSSFFSVVIVILLLLFSCYYCVIIVGLIGIIIVSNIVVVDDCC